MRYLAGISVILFSSQCLASWNVIGEAYDPETRQLQYIEEHYHLDQGQHRVLYKEPDGTIFAKKLLDYTSGMATPNVIQNNNRNGERIEISEVNDRLKVSYRKRADRLPKNARLERRENTVIDAGFNSFIQSEWSELTQGKKKSISYVAPSRGAHVQLRISKIKCQKKGNTCFNISGGNWLSRLLITPISLTYNTETKQLLQFNGVSNISTAKGEYKPVNINYQYTTGAP